VKIAVVGSRSFGDRRLPDDSPDFEANERDYYAMCSILGVCDFSEIISGGARGADRLAERFGVEHDIETTVCPAEWDKFPGHKAAYERNKLMVSLAEAVIAFWDGKSKGTRMTMQLCWKARKPLMIVRTDLLEVKA